MSLNVKFNLVGSNPLGFNTQGFSIKKKDTTPKYGDVDYVNPVVPLDKYGSSGTQSYAKPQAPTPTKQNTVNTPGIITPPAQPQYYDRNTGLLTNEGRSAGMKEVNAPKVETSTMREQPKINDAGKITYPGLISQLLQKMEEGSEGVNKAREDLTKFQTGTSQKIADIKSDPIPLEFQQGRAQVVQQASAEKERALQTGLANALEERGQTISGMTSAAGLLQPQQVPYSNQYLDPTTGLPISGQPGGTYETSVQNIVQQIRSGNMGYSTGISQLSGFGPKAAQDVLAALGPDFNIQQSDALAEAQGASTLQTGTTGGQLTKQAETVKEHMNTLSIEFQKLSAQYGIPLINKGINAVASALGSGPLQAYEIALSNVRDELAKILGGGTSTDGTRATAKELLPDNMTPAQLQSSIRIANELMNTKIQEYTKTPTFNQSGGGFAETW